MALTGTLFIWSKGQANALRPVSHIYSVVHMCVCACVYERVCVYTLWRARANSLFGVIALWKKLCCKQTKMRGGETTEGG